MVVQIELYHLKFRYPVNHIYLNPLIQLGGASFLNIFLVHHHLLLRNDFEINQEMYCKTFHNY